MENHYKKKYCLMYLILCLLFFVIKRESQLQELALSKILVFLSGYGFILSGIVFLFLFYDVVLTLLKKTMGTRVKWMDRIRFFFLSCSNHTFLIYALHTVFIVGVCPLFVWKIIPMGMPCRTWVCYFLSIGMVMTVTTFICTLLHHFFPKFYSVISGGRGN